MKTRKPYVAGSFYPETKERLFNLLREMELQTASTSQANKEIAGIIGGIVPHAGYIYSGRIAIPFFRHIVASPNNFETVIILHPNHSGRGPGIALDVHEAWETPFGQTHIDLELADHLNLEKSIEGHQFEHSAEVMLPMLQYFLPYAFRILPIAIARQDAGSSKLLAEKIRTAIKRAGRKALIIASSDFSHFVSPSAGVALDNMAIEHVMNLNSEGFFRTIHKYDISICGYGPIMTLMEYVKSISRGIKIQMLSRGHSGQVTMHDDVVHYASFLFYTSAGDENFE